MTLIIPIFILITLLFSLYNKNNAYESFINGASDGLKMIPKIFILMLSMVFLTNIIKSSNIINIINFNTIIPKELIMQGLLRPLSNNAATAMMLNIFDKYGIDSVEAIISSVMDASSDTTIYIITLYFGSVGITDYRYALYVGLIADFIGFVTTIIILLYVL